MTPGGYLATVNQQDQQAIDDLFQHLSPTAAQGGARDPQAEARIQQHVQQGPPGLLYHMAQTLVGQLAALQQMRAQLADCQQQLRQSGPPAGFAPPGYRGFRGYQDYGPPPGGYAPRGGGGGGFLAGAGQIALGVGGGILAAEALGDLFSGHGLFGGDRDDYDDRDDRDDRQDYDDRDDGQDYDDQGYGDGGGFDGDQSGW